MVFVPTIQLQDAEPEASADFVTSPCAELGPLEYVTVIAQEAFGSVATVTAPVPPRATGDRTDVNRTNAAGVAGACVGVGAAVTGLGVCVGAVVVAGAVVAGFGVSVGGAGGGVACGDVICGTGAVGVEGRVVDALVAAALGFGARVTMAFSENVARAASLAFASLTGTLHAAQTNASKKPAPLRPT